MMTGCVVLSLLLFFACFTAIHADPTISTSTPTPCYGHVVTLECHHPEVASNSGRYFSTVPTWRENGEKITQSTGIYLHDDTSEDLTHTTLTINITVDHFRNKSFNYSCLLTLADEKGDASGSERSGEVTVDPIDSPGKPHSINLTSDGTNIYISWEHDKSCFQNYTFVFNVTWQEVDTTNTLSSVVNGTAFNIEDLEPGTCYNTCVSAVSTFDERVKSEQECQIICLEKGNSTTDSPPVDEHTQTSFNVAAVVVPLIVFLVIAIVAAVALCLLVRALIALEAPVCMVSWRELRRIQIESRQTPTHPVSKEQNGSSELVIDQGRHRANKDQIRTVSQTSCQRTTTDTDAELGFTGDGILPSSNKLREDLPSSKLDDSPPPDDDQGGSSGVANSNSESEDLRTPVQETTRPSDVHCTIVFCGHGKIIEKDYSEKKDLMAAVHETGPPLTDDNHVKHVFPMINGDSESGHLQISEQETSLPIYGCDELCISEVTNDYKKPLNHPLRFTHCDSSTVSAPCMPSDIGGFLFSPFEYQLHDEKERICHEREEMSTSVHETQLPLPTTAASITKLKCMEEPLSTTTCVASGEGPMTLTQSSYECADVPIADDSNINHELDSVSYEHTDVNNMQTLANSKMPEAVSDCVCMSSGCQICCTKESRGSKRELIPSEPVTEEGKSSIQRTECPRAKQTLTQSSEKIYSYLGSLETGQKLLRWQQSLRMLPDNKPELLQYTPKRSGVVYNDRGQSCCTFVPWLAYLFETVRHFIGALLVLWQVIGTNIALY